MSGSRRSVLTQPGTLASPCSSPAGRGRPLGPRSPLGSCVPRRSLLPDSQNSFQMVLFQGLYRAATRVPAGILGPPKAHRPGGPALASSPSSPPSPAAALSPADPDWASYKLGVFICLNCSGVHRNFPDISKVKSVRLDFWDDSVVEVARGAGGGGGGQGAPILQGRTQVQREASLGKENTAYQTCG